MKSRLLVAAIGVPTVAVIVLLLPSIATAVMVALVFVMGVCFRPVAELIARALETF